ncbi:MAG: EamA family transporter [Novosphingobium sp.]
MSGQNASRAESRAGPGAGIVVPFLLVALVWGSTWIVIKDQISTVPPGWGATWRFALGAVGMVVLALLRRESLRLPADAQRLAAIVGVAQFSLNFQFIYPAEHYLTSGLVAVLFALLLVPNALLSRLFLGTRIGGRFMAGTAVAMVGIGMLLLHEYRVAPPSASVPLGIALTCGALLSASTANVLQQGAVARRTALVPMLAWAMIWATVANVVLSSLIYGPPVFDSRPAAVGGIVYLGLVGSVLTFPMYFSLIRKMGAGRAAYSGVLTPVVAMGLSTLFEGYRWSFLAGAGAVTALAGLIIALSSSAKDRG